MPLAVVARTDKRSNKNRRLPLLAQSGRANPVSECLLLGVKRTWISIVILERRFRI